ncbi:Cell wall integrity transcriptional regulator CAS5 [Orchesella cincta]|uniref:Cell wall integrity transcriptional regulator CAS5 n=1 Tax=Orchesella cincta TaxID=48709 RepID=A0A1D2M4H1_ORCCI|nr:Cell wall integrity transcriptional regulator CAS5 [Orchesella cincta]
MQQCPNARENDDRKLHGLWKTKTVRGKKAAWFCHCKNKFHSYQSLRNHFVMKTQHKNLRCLDPECCKTFHLGEQLKRHCREVHGRVVFHVAFATSSLKTKRGIRIMSTGVYSTIIVPKNLRKNEGSVNQYFLHCAKELPDVIR